MLDDSGPGGVKIRPVQGISLQSPANIPGRTRANRESGMFDRMQTFSREDLQKVHDATMKLMGVTGIVFNEDEALDIFRQNGFKVEASTVYFTEEQVMKAVAQAPERITIRARNPEKSVIFGGDDFIMLPGYGAPFVADLEGNQKSATLEDYKTFCKLIQTSPYLDMLGFMMVEPHDIPADTGHLDMLLANLTFSDLPTMGCTVDRQATKDTLEMLAMAFGGGNALEGDPVCAGLINSLSPLRYSSEMAGCLIELVRGGQVALIAAMVMAGASGPVTLPGVMTLQNAEILAGVALAQLAKPGAAVIYGSTSSATDMRTGGPTIGSPELLQMISATAQMARFYGLPSRSGGCLTDSHVLDYQSGSESGLAISTAVRNGVNFILHSAGIVGTYIAMSFHKYLVDEEVCGVVKRLVRPMEITDENIGLKVIEEVGPGGHYLTHPKTFQLCRTEFYMSKLHARMAHQTWQDQGSKSMGRAADDALKDRLAAYRQPDMDVSIVKDLESFISRKKT